MAAAASNIYQFKITLKHVRPPIWRRIQVPEMYNFYDLHCAIQDAMGWLHCHLHQFEARNPKTGLVVTIGQPQPTGDIKILQERKAELSKYFPSVKSKVNYEYDFGDGWEHTIVLEKILPAKEDEQYPKCIDGKRACPPEDCGGVDGYEDFILAMADPNHEEYAENKEWYENRYGVEFSADAFDPKSVVFKNCPAH